MLTSLQIGQNGRLGNQMFQYAALLGTAFVRGYDWKLQENDNVELRKVFKAFCIVFNLNNGLVT